MGDGIKRRRSLAKIAKLAKKNERCRFKAASET
jgi:hypothetical protein